MRTTPGQFRNPENRGTPRKMPRTSKDAAHCARSAYACVHPVDAPIATVTCRLWIPVTRMYQDIGCLSETSSHDLFLLPAVWWVL